MPGRIVIIMLWISTILPGVVWADSWQALEAHAAREHGELGRRAARFLMDHRPEVDNEIDARLLTDNLDLAIRAREEFPWAGAIPESLFFNDVLPYASLDERRENWRPALHATAGKIVRECQTARDAAQTLNRDLFTALNVHYNTGRKKPNQSPAESIAQQKASCTGLSILLVDACRAVGIPARVAGVAKWKEKQGNHTWVEIWDGRWHFMGADEYDSKGLDRAWFVRDAANAVGGDPSHAVWASSWRTTGSHFVLAWNPTNLSVAGVDVTDRYKLKPRVKMAPPEVKVDATGHAKASSQSADRQVAACFVRAWDKRGGTRITLQGAVVNKQGVVLDEFTTRSGRADLNDMPSILVEDGQQLHLTHAGHKRIAMLPSRKDNRTIDLYWDELGLGRDEAEALVVAKWERLRGELKRARKAELDNKEIVHGDHRLKFKVKTFGEPPATGRSLWISMHGGGGAPAEVNDRQWNNQIKLYQPEEGIYLAPRAPTNTWNLWHQAHIDPLFDRLIESFVVSGDVDPDRVYLMGYSAGGDGVYQLGPRLADRFAAASMMAGHPNEASPLGLRNLPFAIFMGGDDDAYKRNQVAGEWGEKLAQLHRNDPTGYVHLLRIYPDTGHWMKGQDAEAVPWMAKQVREVWPERIVWFQDDVIHERFYWLSLEPGQAQAGQQITAAVDGQKILIQSESISKVILRLRDCLIDLDKPVEVLVNGEPTFSGFVPRREEAIDISLRGRADPRSAATALLPVNWKRRVDASIQRTGPSD